MRRQALRTLPDCSKPSTLTAHSRRRLSLRTDLLAKHSMAPARHDKPAMGEGIVIRWPCQEATPWSSLLFFLFLMLRSIFLSASIALGALAPLSAEAAASCGYASHYGHGDGFHGRLAANGSRFNAYGLTLASRYLPFGTRVRVVNAATGKSVIAKSTDRGPFVDGRVLDLSYVAFAAIANPAQGVVKVCYSIA
jgi:rare lipoprotein A